MNKLKNILRNLFFISIFFMASQSYAMTMHDINSFASDASITTQIRSKVLLNSSISNLRVDIGTVDGVVYLDGTVDTDAEAAALIKIAQSINGVKKVDASKLKVRNAKYSLADVVITSEINGLFLREKTFIESPIAIMVETVNGVVRLTGSVSNEAQVKKAIALASSVEGVKRIESKIEVEVEDATS